MTDDRYVLYVDGDPDRRRRVRETLDGATARVATAEGADPAVATLRAERVDCVVSEYRLPETDGLSFYERIAARHPDVAFVLYTGHGSEALAGEALAAGVDGYVPRSASPDTLRERVAAAADRARASGTDSPRSDSGDRPPSSGDVSTPANPELPPGPDTPDGPSIRRAFESLGDAVYALDADGYVTWVGGKLVETFGYEPGELVGRHVAEFVPDPDLRRGAGLVAELRAGSGDDYRTYEAGVRTSDGRQVPCEVTLSPIPGGDGGVVGVIREVTERKRVERRLREEKRRIRALHAVASRLVGCRSEREIYETTVEAAREALGVDGCAVHLVEDGRLRPVSYAPPLARGDGGVASGVRKTPPDRGDSDPGDAAVSDGVPGSNPPERAVTVDPADPGDPLPEYAAPREVGEAVRAARRTGESRRVDDCRGSDGPDFDGYRSLLVVPVGERAVFLGTARDPGAFDEEDADLAEILTAHATDALERVEFETELRRERDRFAALFENVPHPVVSTAPEDGEPLVREVNPAFERTFGLAETDIVGESLDDYLVPAGERAREEAAEVNERAMEGDHVETEVRRRTDEGLRTFLLTAYPVELDDRTVVFGHYTDITERRQRRERLEVLNRVLRHDLRNGMNVVKGAAELLADHVDEAGQPHADAIVSRAEDLLSMAEKTRAVQQTLDNRDSAGPVDVAECAREAVAECHEDHPDATVRVDAPERALVTADEFVDEAVAALVENAVVHNDRETPEVAVSVDVDDRAGQVVVAVADDGPGIPEDELALFDEDREITQLRHASGLGLWLVNWVVTRAGGDLTFEDNDPRGTVVGIRLPRTFEPPALADGGRTDDAR
ncbi:hypothetical protein BRD00_05975 [Halobacteriales archaeon QS_8_69_26]|nr:MAG: hypothetical protein BRD00_05975 [Halobacteriales archaeon QS_8_69_26]